MDSPAVEIATPRAVRSKSRYVDTFAGFTDDEVRSIAEVKRFMECHEGDRDFRQAVEEGGAFTDAQRQMLEDIGLRFEPEAMELLWKAPEIMARIRTLTFQVDSFEELPDSVHSALADYPLLRNWLIWRFRWTKAGLEQKRMVLTTPTLSPAYTAWRSRRMNAVRNELGSYGWDIDHPCHAVELAVGCSVGCGFCAFDAKRLETVFDYDTPGNRELIRGVASGMLENLGWPSAHGMLYWSTEPADNPHYTRFLREWEEVTGGSLCTATARAKDEWVKDLRAFYGRMPAPWPRISVLSRNTMRRLHKRFTPLELRDTVMLMQQGDAEDLRAKVPGGREKMMAQLIESEDLRRFDPDDLPETLDIPQGSIACISGFLVNMVARTIKLISPCYTSWEHRYGYRTYDEARFTGPEDFGTALSELIERSMVVEPYAEMPVRWRDDLRYVSREDGFTLMSPTVLRDFRRGAAHRAVGPLVAAGDRTWGQVLDALSADPEVGPVAGAAVLSSLFERGYLCELAITRDHRDRRGAAAAPARAVA